PVSSRAFFFGRVSGLETCSAPRRSRADGQRARPRRFVVGMVASHAAVDLVFQDSSVLPRRELRSRRPALWFARFPGFPRFAFPFVALVLLALSAAGCRSWPSRPVVDEIELTGAENLDTDPLVEGL